MASTDNLSSRLVAKLTHFIPQGQTDEVAKVMREIENRSKRNIVFSAALVDHGVIPRLVTLLELEDLKVELKRRVLGTLVNVTFKQTKGKEICVELNLLKLIVDNLNSEKDITCRKWCVAILANLVTLNEAKMLLVMQWDGIVLLIKMLSDRIETPSTRGIAAMVLGNLINDSNEHAREAFERGACPVLVDMLTADYKECIDNSCYVIDIISSKVPESHPIFLECHIEDVVAEVFGRYEDDLSLKTVLHLVSTLISLSELDESVLNKLSRYGIDSHLERLLCGHTEEDFTIAVLDTNKRIEYLLSRIKNRDREIEAGKSFDLFETSRNLNLEEEAPPPDVGLVAQLRNHSQDLNSSGELECLIKLIFETCKDNESISLDLLKEGIVRELLKLVNSPSRTVRKFSAATLASLTHDITEGIDSFSDNEGVSLLIQTIPNEDENVVRRLLITVVSNALVSPTQCSHFATNGGIGLYMDIVQSDQDSIARSKAALGLGNFLNQSTDYVDDLVATGCCEILLQLLDHPNSKCKNAAARTLGLIIFKQASDAVTRIVSSQGVEKFCDVILDESVGAESKLPASWCLSQLVIESREALEYCREKYGLLDALEVLNNSDYDKADKSLMFEKLKEFIDILKISD